MHDDAVALYMRPPPREAIGRSEDVHNLIFQFQEMTVAVAKLDHSDLIRGVDQTAQRRKVVLGSVSERYEL